MLIFIFTLAACSSSTNREDILIGADFPMSGGLSVYGEALYSGLSLGIEDVNSQGGVNGQNITLILEDNAGNPQKSIDAANLLLEVRDVDILLSTMAGVTGPIVPLAEGKKKVLLYAVAVDSWADENTWIFKDSVDAYYDCGRLADWAQRQGMRELVIFGTQAEFSEKCKESFYAKGITPATYVTYPPGAHEFRAELTKISSLAPDAIILSAYANECIHIWNQIAELGLNTTFLLPFTQGGCGEGRAMKEAQTISSPIIGLDFLINETSPQYVQFITQYRSKYDKDPDFPWFTWLGYDWAQYIALAFGQCPDPHDSACLRSALEKIEYTGAGGHVAFEGRHKTFRQREFIQYSEGKWLSLK